MGAQIIALVVIMFILITYVISSRWKVETEIEAKLAEIAALREAEKSGTAIKTVERVPMVAPTHIPIYTKIKLPGKPERTVADYTSVPKSIGSKLKPMENPRNLILDRKITYFGMGRTTETGDTKLDLNKFTPALAESMAEGHMSVEMIEWIKALTTDEVGRIFSETQATLDTINDELIAMGRTKQTLEQQYSKEQEMIQTIEVSGECNDQSGDCNRWRENNDCIINAAYMFQQCPKACGTCNLSPEQLAELEAVYGIRDLPNCVYHEGYETSDITE